ncbi:hypothetical protein JST97_20405 [bacterium]|nr:hypothetical protein [bacterium]
MKKRLILCLTLACLGCSQAPPPAASPTATATGPVAPLAGDSFELMGHEATVTFDPAAGSIKITSMLRLGTEGTGFTLKPAQAQKMNEIMLAARPEVIRSSERLTSSRALLAMEHQGIRYLASANAPTLKAAREALEMYMPHKGGIGPDASWLMGKLEGTRGKWSITANKEKYRLTGPAANLAFLPGTTVLVVGSLKSDHLYEAARMSEWLGPDQSGLDVPALEASLAPASDYVRDDSTGLLTSRRRILVNLKDGAGLRHIPKLLEAAGPGAHLIACWPDNMIIMFEIPDSPDLTNIRNSVKKLENVPVVESAAADVAMGEAGDSFRRPDQ